MKIAFPFPQNGQISHEMKGLRERSLLWLEGKSYDFPGEGKFTSSHLLPQKMLWVFSVVALGRMGKTGGSSSEAAGVLAVSSGCNTITERREEEYVLSKCHSSEINTRTKVLV